MRRRVTRRCSGTPQLYLLLEVMLLASGLRNHSVGHGGAPELSRYAAVEGLVNLMESRA